MAKPKKKYSDLSRVEIKLIKKKLGITKVQDIDIAILGDVSYEDEVKIRNEFDEIDMEYMVDIVFIKEINNQELIQNIEREGVKI